MHAALAHRDGAIPGQWVTTTVVKADAVVVCALGNEYLPGATIRPQFVPPAGRVRLESVFQNKGGLCPSYRSTATAVSESSLDCWKAKRSLLQRAFALCAKLYLFPGGTFPAFKPRERLP